MKVLVIVNQAPCNQRNKRGQIKGNMMSATVAAAKLKTVCTSATC